jgi:hypothetical protein
VRARDVIKQALAAYRAWGGYLVFLTTALYAVVGTVGLFVNALLGPTAFQLLLTAAATWAVALVVDAVAAIEEPTADRTLQGRFAALVPYLATVTVASLLYNLVVGIGFVFFIVPGLVFLTWWSLIVPVVVLERKGIGAAFSRSKKLVSGRGMTVFWTLVMAGVLALVPVFAAGLLLQGVATGQSAQLIAGVIHGALATPFVALCLVILYADLRTRFTALAPVSATRG